MHPVLDMLLAAAEGRFPPVDGRVEVMAPTIGGDHAVVEFTGHAIVLTDRDPEQLVERGADGFGGAAHPDIVRWLAGPNGWIGSHDAVLVARGTGGGTIAETDAYDDHPRVVRSRAHRREVRVHADDTGLITIGRGLVGRLEMSIELLPSRDHGIGDGRRLVGIGRSLVNEGSPVFAQVAPGNAASLRAFLSSGFAPIGAEILIQPGPEVTV